MSKARDLAERALVLDPTLSEAWATIAAVAEQHEHDMTRSDSLYARALDLDPRNARIRAQWALWRQLRGAMSDDVVLAELRRSVENDPLNAWVGAMHSFRLAIAGRHEESILEAGGLSTWTRTPSSPVSAHAGPAAGGSLDRAMDMAPGLLMDSSHVWALGLPPG
jgi:hypothetical protein